MALFLARILLAADSDKKRQNDIFCAARCQILSLESLPKWRSIAANRQKRPKSRLAWPIALGVMGQNPKIPDFSIFRADADIAARLDVSIATVQIARFDAWRSDFRKSANFDFKAPEIFGATKTLASAPIVAQIANLSESGAFLAEGETANRQKNAAANSAATNSQGGSYE